MLSQNCSIVFTLTEEGLAYEVTNQVKVPLTWLTLFDFRFLHEQWMTHPVVVLYAAMKDYQNSRGRNSFMGFGAHQASMCIMLVWVCEGPWCKATLHLKGHCIPKEPDWSLLRAQRSCTTESAKLHFFEYMVCHDNGRLFRALQAQKEGKGGCSTGSKGKTPTTHLARKLTKQKSLWSSPILIPYLDTNPTIPEQTILIVSISYPWSHTYKAVLSLQRVLCRERRTSCQRLGLP